MSNQQGEPAVSTKRNGSDDHFDERMGAVAVMAEAARTGDAGYRPSEPPRTGEEKISVFWRVFGGTLISVAALVSITVFNSMNGAINDLRSEVSRLNEAKAEAAKKDDLNALRTQLAAHAEYRREIDSLKERAGKHRAELDEVKKESAAQVELIKRDKLTMVDTLKKDLAGMEVLKERVATVTADAKAAKDDLTKLRQEVDKNAAHDIERRDRRDAQMKQLDETLKDIQKNLLEAREKIARLEGQQTPAKPAVGAPADTKTPASKSKTNSGPRPATPTGEK